MELIGKSEVAAHLQVCERTLENLLQRGEFPPPLRLGKKALWTKSVVEAWLEQQLQPQLEWKPPTRKKARRNKKTQAVLEAPVPTEPQAPTRQ